MNRQEYNRKILSKLNEIVEKHPYLRFGQILVDCDIIQYKKNVLTDGDREDILTVDPFNEESEITWERIKDNKFVFKELYN